MWSRLCCYVGAIAIAHRALAMPTSEHLASMPMGSLFSRDTEDFNPDDLSFIKNIAAIGDSYSAGIGAGKQLTGDYHEWNCRRFDHSYPYLINEDPRLGDVSNRKFQFESCSGAQTSDVIEQQIPALDFSQQVILLSVGGNDVELVNVLNQCIYQWSTLNKKQSLVGEIAKLKGEKWAQDIDFDKLSRGCEGQIDITSQIIQSEQFSKQLDTTIDMAKFRLALDGVLYVTGYARFFSETLDTNCEKVSWRVWGIDPLNLLREPEYLGYNRRKELNQLVDMMNKKIEAAVKRAGSQVTFINYDEMVGRYHGRYCEPGVDESEHNSNTRDMLMFYKLSTLDPFGSNPWKRSDDPHLNGTFAGDMNQLTMVTQYLSPDIELVYDDKITDDDETEGHRQVAKEMSSKAEFLGIELPNLLPNGYGRVFHPQILLHEIIANMILFEMSNRRLKEHGMPRMPLIDERMDSCPIDTPDDKSYVLKYKKTEAGKAVKKGTKLRILPVGDSITVGFPSEKNGGDGNGYRGQLKKDLSGDKVVFAGTESSGSMSDGYYAAWSGKTIQYMSDHVGPSLKQRPNVILLAAGTNDMNPNRDVSKEGNDPEEAADRLGKLIDKMTKECPDATILVAMIINTCREQQSPATKEFQKLIPGVVESRNDAGRHVLAVDFTSFKTSDLQDCIHPSNDGYKIMGDYWYSFIHQIPDSWIKDPKGPDPDRLDESSNGGIDKDIPRPDWGTSPIQVTSKDAVAKAGAAAAGGKDGLAACGASPKWKSAGKVALGKIGHNGDWKYHSNWEEAGELARGVGKDKQYVRLHDMNGDGKADYVWIHPETGQIRCWINNLPDAWSPAGNNGGIIGGGVGPGKTIFMADMNGDGMADYLVVDPDNGSVRVWWNYGTDKSWANGWKFVEGGQIASGVPHANLQTLRFPDINGDGRADYVYIGEGGSLNHYMNTGSPGGTDVKFHAMGGIATGAVDDISKLVLADMNGDGRDDYLIWDDDGGLTGYLSQPSNREGVPIFENQGPAKSIAKGINKDPSDIRLADMDGDGKDDYVYVGDNGALSVWYNRGTTDDGMTMNGLRFADIDGDGVDDYVWIDPDTGAPTVYINMGVSDAGSLGWAWKGLNGGEPIASGAAPGSQVVFGDIDGDGLDDYLDLDPKTGRIKAFLNEGKDKGSSRGWKFKSIGQIASGLGPGHRVRIADIDGDGRDDYIYLKDNGGTTIYRNIYKPDSKSVYEPLPEADASGIGQSPDEIDFVDINGDGKADYVWTRKLDGRVMVWYNEYPEKPTWREGGEIARGVGTSGANVRFARLHSTGRADYIAMEPKTGALAAWLNGCDDPQARPPPTSDLTKPDPSKNKKTCYNSGQKSSYDKINLAANSFCNDLKEDPAGPVFSDFYKESKKSPSGNYHFAMAFEVFEGCSWKFTYDECMKYFKVPVDSCNCSKMGDKQGGTVRNNCIYARIDPNYGG